MRHAVPVSNLLATHYTITQEVEPHLTEELQGKKYAGVCAGAAFLTTALLRESELLSGVVVGFSPNNKTVTTEQAHAASFVVLPGNSGGDEIFLVDGTPGGDTENQDFLVSQGVVTDSLEEQQKIALQQLEEKKNRALEIFDDLEINVNNVEAHSSKEEYMKEALWIILNNTVTPEIWDRTR